MKGPLVIMKLEKSFNLLNYKFPRPI